MFVDNDMVCDQSFAEHAKRTTEAALMIIRGQATHR
jgi:hypothetical protein